MSPFLERGRRRDRTDMQKRRSNGKMRSKSAYFRTAVAAAAICAAMVPSPSSAAAGRSLATIPTPWGRPTASRSAGRVLAAATIQPIAAGFRSWTAEPSSPADFSVASNWTCYGSDGATVVPGAVPGPATTLVIDGGSAFSMPVGVAPPAASHLSACRSARGCRPAGRSPSDPAARNWSGTVSRYD